MNKLKGPMLKETPSLKKPYAKGGYNKSDQKEQWIRITEGCPNKCVYCRESFENGVEPIYYKTPEIVRNSVKIMDMNLIYKPKALEIIRELGSKKVNGKKVYYELICGIDYRYLTDKIAQALKENGFIKIRIAWDHGFKFQKRIKEAIKKLTKAGYNAKGLTVFMVCNWKISYNDNLAKLDLCKVWNVKVADCWFDNQLSPNIKPIHWRPEQIKDFRARVRKHNQLINFRIDPEYRSISNRALGKMNLKK